MIYLNLKVCMTLMRVLSIVYIYFCVIEGINAQTITHEVAAWRASYFLDDNYFSLEDLTILANLCYFSFLRSYHTLMVQRAGIATLNTTRQLWHNMTATRRNPSRAIPYEYDEHRACTEYADFCAAYSTYLSVNKRYSQVAETIIHGACVTSKKTMSALEELRNRARTIVADSITQVPIMRSENNQSETFLSIIKKHGGVLYDIGNTILDGFWRLTPFFAAKAFVETDREYNRVSQYAWESLMMFEQTGVALWDSIETARAHYYAECYRLVYRYYEIHYPHALDTLWILFDEQGAMLKEPCVMLPQPELLYSKLLYNN
jgi:hypothetical protein